MSYELFGQELKKLREFRGLTQTELAKVLGFQHASSISRIEDGKVKFIDRWSVLAIAEYFGLKEAETDLWLTLADHSSQRVYRTVHELKVLSPNSKYLDPQYLNLLQQAKDAFKDVGDYKGVGLIVSYMMELLNKHNIQAEQAPHLSAPLLDDFADATFFEGRVTASVNAGRKALRLAEAMGDATLMAKVLQGLTESNYWTGNYDQAIKRLTVWLEKLSSFQKTNPFALAMVKFNLALMKSYINGKDPSIDRLLEDALPLLESHPWWPFFLDSLNEIRRNQGALYEEESLVRDEMKVPAH